MVCISLRTRQWAVCAVSMAALGSHTVQADTTVASANASLSNLTFRLIDLDPNDGIAPGMTIQGQGFMGAFTSFDVNDPSNTQQVQITSPIFPSQNLNQGLSSATLSASGLTGTSITTVDSTLQQVLTEDGSDASGAWSQSSFDMYLEAGGTFGYHPPLDGFPENPLTITLTAHTRLVLEGTGSTALALSNQAMHEALAALNAQTGGFSPDAQRFSGFDGRAAAGLTALLATADLSQPDAPFQVSRFSFEDELQESTGFCDSVEGCHRVFAPDQSRTSSQNFTLEYTNTASQSTDVSLMFHAAGVVQQSGYLNVREIAPPIPTIPEPGTYALMGLGLAGLAWSRRRHATA